MQDPSLTLGMTSLRLPFALFFLRLGLERADRIASQLTLRMRDYIAGASTPMRSHYQETCQAHAVADMTPRRSAPRAIPTHS